MGFWHYTTLEGHRSAHIAPTTDSGTSTVVHQYNILVHLTKFSKSPKKRYILEHQLMKTPKKPENYFSQNSPARQGSATRVFSQGIGGRSFQESENAGVRHQCGKTGAVKLM